jgi:8-amino-7-oxononanoate synthase
MTGTWLEANAGYRALRRRLDAASGGLRDGFFRARRGVSGSILECDGRKLVDYSGYNYLGLSGHPEVSAAAQQAIAHYGTSASGSRILSGHLDLHAMLEARLATFLGTEDCIVFVSGYLTNVTLLSHLFGRRDLIVLDSGAHNSLETGARLAKSEVLSYPAGEWTALEAALPPRGAYRQGVLVTEGIYSMDGRQLDLSQALQTKQRHNLLLMVDEAHSLGVLGQNGRGICEQAGLPSTVIDIHMGTLSKALASSGGYVAGDAKLIEYIRYLAPGFIFSVGLSPADTAAALAALEVLEREPERPQRLRAAAARFRQLASEAGLMLTGAEEAPIASLLVGNATLCMDLSRRLYEAGVHVPPVVHPAVPASAARLRFFITTEHTEAQFRITIEVLAREANRLGCLPHLA